MSKDHLKKDVLILANENEQSQEKARKPSLTIETTNLGNTSSKRGSKKTVDSTSTADSSKDEIDVRTPVYLSHRYSIYFDEGLNQENYNEEIVKTVIGTFETVQEFWSYWNNLGSLTKRQFFNLRVFRKGITPCWEDPRNRKGGKWVFFVPKNTVNMKLNLFTEIALAMIGGAPLGAQDRVNGIILCSRPKYASIQIWVGKSSTLSGEKIQSLIPKVHIEKPEYAPHDETIQQISTPPPPRSSHHERYQQRYIPNGDSYSYANGNTVVHTTSQPAQNYLPVEDQYFDRRHSTPPMFQSSKMSSILDGDDDDDDMMTTTEEYPNEGSEALQTGKSSSIRGMMQKLGTSVNQHMDQCELTKNGNSNPHYRLTYYLQSHIIKLLLIAVAFIIWRIL